MSLWGHVFAAFYDRCSAKAEAGGLSAHRTALLSGVAGDVLEIGGGTGANLALYGDGLSTLTIVEPEKPMLRRLQRRAASTRPDAIILRAPAEELPFDDASFDVAVSTLVLCTVDDVPRSLHELHRVLRPGGRLVFMEHVRSDDPKVARLQDRMLPINVRLAHGCHCNRPTLDSIRAAGFTVTALDHDTIHGAPAFIRPLIVGVAERAAGDEPDASISDGLRAR